MTFDEAPGSTLAGASREAFRAMVESNVDGIVVVGREGVLKHANPAAASMFGGTPADLVGKPFPFFHDLGTTGEVDIRRADGSGGRAELRAAPLTWEGEDALLVSVRDMTDLLRAQAGLQRSERRMQELLEQALAGIAVWRDGETVYVNSTHEEIFGAARNLFGRGASEHVHPDDAPRLADFVESFARGAEQLGDVVLRFRHSDPEQLGGMRWVHVHGQHVEFGGREAVLLSSLDISERKENAQIRQLHDKMAALGRVSATIGHEIRNYLSSINLHATALRRAGSRSDAQRVEHILDRILESSARIETVIDRVRDFSRPSSPTLGAVDPNQVVMDAVELCLGVVQRAEVRLELNLDPNLRVAQLDEHLLTRVIVNLVGNAADALRHYEGERVIRIFSSCAGEQLCLRVEDSGPGIPLGSRSAVFDPFFTTKRDGSGIGLSICARIVADHGGGMRVSDSELGGAALVVELPLVAERVP